MKFNIQAVNFNPTDNLLELLDRKLNKLEKFKEHIVGGEVFLKLDNIDIFLYKNYIYLNIYKILII